MKKLFANKIKKSKYKISKIKKDSFRIIKTWSKVKVLNLKQKKGSNRKKV